MARTKSPSSKTKSAGTGNGHASDVVAAAPALENGSDTRKLEAKKNDSRTNVVPINLEDEIRRRAYELAEQRGFQGGSDTDDWLTAEREVLERYHQQSA